MLSYALAIAVALSSLVLFSTAFLMSDLHRKDDFLWSGVGLFYALILWYCARNITGTVLLGQAAATTLLVSYSWQTLKLRKAIANPQQAESISNFSVLQSISGLLKRKKPEVKSVTPTKKAPKPKVTEQEIAIPDTPSAAVTAPETTTEKVTKETDLPATEEVAPAKEPEAIAKEPAEVATPEVAATPIKDNQTSQEPETPTQTPLPSKMPEVASKIENTEVSTEDASTINTDPQLNQDKSATEIKTSPKSPLDSLETVEVAEVLEAVPEDETSNRDSDPNNIIEVTTTEINTTIEDKKTVQNQDDQSEH